MADPEGGCNRRAPPLNFYRLCLLFVFCVPFCIRMVQNKPRIARESIYNPRASRALKWALDHGREATFRFTREPRLSLIEAT